MNKDKFKDLCDKHGVEREDLPSFMPDMDDKELKKFVKGIAQAKKEALSDLKLSCNKCAHMLYITDGAEKTGREILSKLKGLDGCPTCGNVGNGWTIAGLGNYDREQGDEDNDEEENES